MKTVIRVRGMDCSDETSAVKDALQKLDGVRSVEPNIVNARVTIEHLETINLETLTKCIEKAGIQVERTEKVPHKNLRSYLVLVSGASIAMGMLFANLSDYTFLSIPLYLLSIAIGGFLVAPKALRSLRSRRLDMNVLMCIATLGAVIIGEFAEGAAVVFLFSLAEWLESLSLERARKAIESLLNLVPPTALLKTANSTQEVPVSEIKLDSVILVRSGSKVPLDGEVVNGTSAVNQAPLTGESVPVEKSSGDFVLAGSINGEGSLEVRVTKTQENTKLAEIVRLVEEADKKRAPTQRFVDQFASYYTPAVLVFAILLLLIGPTVVGGDWQTWFYRSLVLLVIACPCALVIATPVSIVSGLTNLARHGVLIKGGAGLEKVGGIVAIAVDKTGTITQGKPSVVTVIPMKSNTETELLSVAASIDGHSSHPLAKAVALKAGELKLNVPTSTGYQAVTGRGAEAVIDGHFYFVGNHRFAHENAVCTPELEKNLEELEKQALSVVVVGHRPHAGCKGDVLGILGIGDPVRPEAIDAIASLKKAGVRSVIMLSGDNQRTVNAIASSVGIKEAYGDLLPTDKVLKVKELRKQFGSIAMVGDGVNDAPAMASADLGIAMGASGTDTAIEAADLTLMQDKLVGVADAIQMGKRTLRVIRFNTAFALATKLIFLGLSVAGITSLWLAIAADTGATLLVVANALRLLRWNS